MPSFRRGRGGSGRTEFSGPPPEPPCEVGDLVARVADEDAGPAERRRRVAALARAVADSTRRAGTRAVVSGQWLADTAAETAPKIPVRDRATLRAHHPGRSDGEIAGGLVRSASLATAAVGGAAGAVAAVEWAAPPLLLTAPALLAAETLAVIAVEVKLVAELHELHGVSAPGAVTQKAAAYLAAWSRQRAVDPLAVANAGALLGQAAKRELRARILRRFGRSATSLVPLLAGAVAGSEVNRRATRALGGKLLADLREHPPHPPHPAGPVGPVGPVGRLSRGGQQDRAAPPADRDDGC